MNDLHQRVQRDIVSRTLHAPELLQAPLAERPLEKALDALARNFSNAREWRRLLVLLESRSSANVFPNGSRPRAGDDIAAIRSYLAGQNFELAELWPDAILAYKAVLSTGAELGPIKDAVERLKVLAKEHPEGLDPPRTPAATIPSPQR